MMFNLHFWVLLSVPMLRFVLQVAFVDSTNFSAIFLCVFVPPIFSYWALSFKSFSMSFSYVYISICMCALFLGHLLCKTIFQINAQIVRPGKGKSSI